MIDRSKLLFAHSHNESICNYLLASICWIKSKTRIEYPEDEEEVANDSNESN
jgi:hypothetical protein